MTAGCEAALEGAENIDFGENFPKIPVFARTSPPLAYSMTKQRRSLVWKAYFSA